MFYHITNILFILSSDDYAHQTRHTGYFLPTGEIKDCYVMIDGQNFFYQPVKY